MLLLMMMMELMVLPVYCLDPHQGNSITEVKVPGSLKMVLLGMTGAGKSTTGNIILGKKAFRAEASPSSVTFMSENVKGNVFGIDVTLTDTPGLFDTKLPKRQLKKELGRCINLSLPGPHAFLLVIKLGRFIQQERDTIRWIQDNFGEWAADYTIVVFTGSDQLGRKSVEDFLRESEDLQHLLGQCGNRYHVIDNTRENNEDQVRGLLEKVNQLVEENEGDYYTSEIYQDAQRKIEMEEERKRMEEEKKRMEEEKKRMEEEETKRKVEEERTRIEEERKRIEEEIERKVEEEMKRIDEKNKKGRREEKKKEEKKEEKKKRRMEEGKVSNHFETFVSWGILAAVAWAPVAAVVGVPVAAVVGAPVAAVAAAAVGVAGVVSAVASMLSQED